jgi:hypothetical protein
MATRSRLTFRVSGPVSRLCLVLLFAAWVAVCPAKGRGPAKRALTADEIVSAMVLQNQARAAALRSYVGRRVYKLQYRGFPGDRSAEMTVDVRYTAPNTKKFTIVSESGSKVIIDHVFNRLISGEEEAQNSSNQREITLTPRNYHFEYLGQETAGDRLLYVLRVRPKVKNKFVYRGKVWIDATDFAVVKIDAEPAKNPSFWITHAHVEQKYGKFGAFWLPVQNTSTSEVRVLHGMATLQILYQSYALDGTPTAVEASTHAVKTF